MYEVVLIDDNDYGIKQIKNALSGFADKDIEIKHYFTLHEYKEKQKNRPFIILLDYFFSNERTYGEMFVTEIQMDILIGFSSMKLFSDRIIAAYKEKVSNSHVKLYSIEKSKASDHNLELKKVFDQIFGGH